MASDFHRGGHLFILDGEGFVGEIELTHLLDHRELIVDAVDRGAHRGAEFLVLAQQVHFLRQSFRLGTFGRPRSEEHTSELQSQMRISYAAFCWKKKKTTK